jgi:hypothetical protein
MLINFKLSEWPKVMIFLIVVKVSLYASGNRRREKISMKMIVVG